MKLNRLHALLLTFCLLPFSAGQAQEEITVDFTYDGNHRVDFAAMKGSLMIDEFADERGGADPRLVTSVDFGGAAEGYMAQQPMAELIQEALRQGFAHGNAPLVENDADYSIGGALLAIDATSVDRGGVSNIQITFRTRLELRSGGRVLWTTTLFGRGRVPNEEGIVAAIKGGLTRTVGELVRDDYFKMEIL